MGVHIHIEKKLPLLLDLKLEFELNCNTYGAFLLMSCPGEVKQQNLKTRE